MRETRSVALLRCDGCGLALDHVCGTFVQVDEHAKRQGWLIDHFRSIEACPGCRDIFEGGGMPPLICRMRAAELLRMTRITEQWHESLTRLERAAIRLAHKRAWNRTFGITDILDRFATGKFDVGFYQIDDPKQSGESLLDLRYDEEPVPGSRRHHEQAEARGY